MAQEIKSCKRVTLDDEFYTQYKDAVRELHKYDLRGKRIICPCDNKNSNIYRYLKDCYYDVKCSDKDWRNVNYANYDIVVTNPPFSQINEFINHLFNLKIDFIIVVSDVMRYCFRNGKGKIGNFEKIYFGKELQEFIRPDGSLKSIHCGWISNIQDTWQENVAICKVKL